MTGRPMGAVVLGGYVNGYGLVRSLHDAGVWPIILVDTRRSPASFSRLLRNRIYIASLEDLATTLTDLAAYTGRRLVIYPTSDEHVEILARNQAVLNAVCFLPFNPENVLEASSKSHQYQVATTVGVAVPKTRLLSSPDDVSSLEELQYPILLKPSRRIDLQNIGFRNRLLDTRDDLAKALPEINQIIAADVEVLASEVVPGDDNVYAYTAYRSANGKILRSWTGRKLSQHPDDFGVYASATAANDPQLERDGRAIVEALDCYGICEPEFKLDARDGRFKLMEVNLRSMMWHRTGALVGVNLPEAQWLDASGDAIPAQTQNDHTVVHSFWGHEFANLIGRRNYRTVYRVNRNYGEREWAFWNPKDPFPFFASLISFPRLAVRACLRRFALV